MKKILSGVLLIALFFIGFQFCLPQSSKQSKVYATNEDLAEITIFHTNDTHGRVEKEDSKWSKIIGIDTIASIKEATPHSLLVDAGDSFHGLPIATLTRGEDIVTLMNLAKYDVMTPGNHDFDYGYERLIELSTQAEFKIISANVKKQEANILEANFLKEVDSIKIGFFGLTTPETATMTDPKNVNDLDFEDLYEIAREQVTELKNKGADVIVALTHVGTDHDSTIQSTQIAEQVAGIDVIIDGHSHDRIENGVTVNGTLIASMGEYEGSLGKINLVIDKKTKVLQGKEATLISPEEAWENAPINEITEKITEILNAQKEILSEVIGKTANDLNGEKLDVRTGETNLGNLVADAMRLEANADIAFMNSGSICASIKKGDITRGDLVTILPYGNVIVTKKLTGEQIKSVLEHSVSSYPTQKGGFLQVSGMKFRFDPLKEEGNRVYSITINEKEVESNQTYLVATNDYLAAGGDEYTIFTTINTENEFCSLEEALTNLCKKLSVLNYGKEGRIISIPVTQIRLLKSTAIKLVNGRTYKIGHAVLPKNASFDEVFYQSGNNAVATVSPTGLIITKAKGNCHVNVISKENQQLKATLRVTVTQQVTSIYLKKSYFTIKMKKKKTLSLKKQYQVLPYHVNNNSVSFSSSNKKVAKVVSSGKVKAKKKGICYITIKAKDGSGKFAKIKITVKK